MNSTRWKQLAVGAALLCLAAASCTDTTVQPKSTVSAATEFSDPRSYEEFLAKIYAGLALSGQIGGYQDPDILGIDPGYGQYLRLYWEMEELPTDEAVIAWGDRGLLEMNTQLWSSVSSMVVAMYYRIFFQASLANEFLRQTTDAVLNSRGVTGTLLTQIHQYRAEARFLRALSYWHGIDLFGSIPLVTENDPVGTTPPKQVARDSIYRYIVSELQAIQGQLPQPGPGTYGRATGPAASMLLAKIFLNAGIYTGTPRWSEAMSAVQDVINSGAYSLDPVWRRMFSADNNTSPEIIFPIIQDGVTTQTYGGTTFLVYASCGGTMDPAASGVVGFPWQGLRLKPEAYYSYAAGDGRASYFWTDGQTVEVTDILNFGNGIAAPKFRNLTSTGALLSNTGFVDTDFPLFRLSDAYLMYAELVLRGGGGTRAQALAYVNAIRERAYGDASGDITDSQLTLDFVLAERGRELLWEAHRRTDLIRYGLFTGGRYLWAWKGGVEAGTATDQIRDLMPLPASELAANPYLSQNPGY
jgi:starch-binding outer membrane protein, SusD/RagB family